MNWTEKPMDDEGATTIPCTGKLTVVATTAGSSNSCAEPVSYVNPYGKSKLSVSMVTGTALGFVI